MKKQIFAAAAVITVLGLSACQTQKETGSVAQEQSGAQTGTGAAGSSQTETGNDGESQATEEQNAQKGSGDRSGTGAGHGVFDIPVELEYAQKFTIAKDGDGCSLLTIDQGDPVVVIPKGNSVPETLPDHAMVLEQPLDHIYLASTAAMDFFSSLDAMDSLRLSGAREDGWYIEAAKEAMRDGSLIFAGKYSQPDYELLLSEQCRLAIENTMILHNPEVKEKLEQIGIPVIVERSSYEPEPLGRMEWVKFYGVLLGKEDQAEQLFDEKVETLKEELSREQIQNSEQQQSQNQNAGTDSGLDAKQTEERPTAVFFYINPKGYVNVRKSGDYISKMIQMAGGQYLFTDLGDSDSAMSTVNMQMEEFYAAAKDADYLIYNSTIYGEIQNLDDLFTKSPLLKDFKAVKEGHAWCTSSQTFQQVMGVADLIGDMHRMFLGEEDGMTYLFPLR